MGFFFFVRGLSLSLLVRAWDRRRDGYYVGEVVDVWLVDIEPSCSIGDCIVLLSAMAIDSVPSAEVFEARSYITIWFPRTGFTRCKITDSGTS